MNTLDGRLYESRNAAINAGVDPLNLMMVDASGTQRRRMKIGRNDPCPCGSGLKFKKCHLGKRADFIPAY